MRTAFLVFVICACMSCTGSKGPTFADVEYVLCDLTDDLPQTESLTAAYLEKPLSCFHGEPTHGAIVTIAAITDQRFTQSATLYLPPVDRLSSNEIERKKQIQHFGERLDSLILSFRKAHRGYPHTRIFTQVSKALNEISQVKNTVGNKKLVLLSDGEENNETFSCYAPGFSAALKHHPDTLANVFRTYYPLPASLAGVEISLVHQPGISKDEEYFYLSKGLAALFTSLGAKVTINTSF